MANSTLKSINYQVGKLCRLGSRKAKLVAISNRRKQQLRHLGERIYIFKALQQDEDIWEKDEISQLLLTIADLDQEQEMIIDEINEIKAESPPEESCCGGQDESEGTETEAAAEVEPEAKVEKSEAKPEAEKPEEKTVTKPAPGKKDKKETKAKPKAPRRRAPSKKAAPAKKDSE